MKEQFFKNHWAGRRVAFLGDSITDAIHVGTTKNYWQFLQEMLDIEPLVYGVNGSTYAGVAKQAESLYTQHADDVDAIIVFAGTNDYMGGLPLGEWFTYQDSEVNYQGQMITLRKREIVRSEDTFRGRINIVLEYLKAHFPASQIILMTMLHRSFAEFGGTNIQPAECYGNRIGIYLEEYVNVIKEAGTLWSVPVIDLNALSGLYPMLDAYSGCFAHAVTDRLHPSAAGHYRIALTMLYRLLSLPASFRETPEL